MNRKLLFLAPPLAFAMAAALAWLTAAPAETEALPGIQRIRRPRQPTPDAVSSVDLPTTLNQLEREILHYPAPPIKIHDAQGMEAMLDHALASSLFPGGGMGTIEYAGAWAREEPDAMFNWLVDGGSSSDQRLFYAYILFENWVESDLESALAAASSIQNPKLRSQALLTSIQALSKSDPDRARELMLQNLSLFKDDTQSLSFDSYDKGKSTCDLLMSLPPSEERTHLLAKQLAGISRFYDELLAKAMVVWAQAPIDLRRDLVSAGFYADEKVFDSFDGLSELMRERAETSGDRPDSERFIQLQGAAWAKKDLAEALDWTQAHLKGKKRFEQSARLFEPAASGDFDNALRIWQSLPDGFLKTRAAEYISKGAPPERKSQAEALIQSPSKPDNGLHPEFFD